VRELRTTHDATVDAAYIYLVPHIEAGQVISSTLPKLETPMASVITDLDADGRVLGVELLGVSNLLSSARLASVSLTGARFTYDAAADVAQVDFEPVVEPETVCDAPLIDMTARLLVGFGADGTIVRLAFPDASSLLPASILSDATAGPGC